MKRKTNQTNGMSNFILIGLIVFVEHKPIHRYYSSFYMNFFHLNLSFRLRPPNFSLTIHSHIVCSSVSLVSLVPATFRSANEFLPLLRSNTNQKGNGKIFSVN